MSGEERKLPNIRTYQEKDKEYVQSICVRTAPEVLRQHDAMRQLLLIAFCNYYIEREPHNCFIAANEQDKAVGYILCAENAEAWHDVFSKEYIAPIAEQSARSFLEATCQACLDAAKEYPAHLHTDILPEYQRKGLGSLLMEALIHHLRNKGIPGLMLSVANDNAGANQFYKRRGFHILMEKPNETIMGIKL